LLERYAGSLTTGVDVDKSAFEKWLIEGTPEQSKFDFLALPPGAGKSQALGFINWLGFIKELAENPVSEQPSKPDVSRQWRIPSHALPVKSQTTVAVFQTKYDLGDIRRGDYLFIDREQRNLTQVGYYLAQFKETETPMLIQIRFSNRGPFFEFVSYNNVAFDPKEYVKEPIGRVVARFESASLYP
jgi:hypothetical protein